jgi:hypothetical protein
LITAHLYSDELLYNARIHPEQYSNTLSAAEITRLHASLIAVTSLAVDTLADSSRFPETWLFNHRWGKGKKGGSRLPNGAQIVFLTVGGRTSAVVPSVQKKSSKVTGEIKTALEEEDVVKDDNHESILGADGVDNKAPNMKKILTPRTSTPTDTIIPIAKSERAQRALRNARVGSGVPSTEVDVGESASKGSSKKSDRKRKAPEEAVKKQTRSRKK